MTGSSAHLTSARHDSPPSRLLANRAFLLLWAAYGISAMGDHISELAVLKAMDAMEADNMTQLQAMMNFMFMFPFFVLGPFNGLLADRLPRRGIMIAADLIRVAIMLNFSYLLARFTPLGSVGGFVPLLLVGVFAAMFSPARSALLPTLIREDHLVRANALTSGLGVISTMVAVLIGGWLARNYEPRVAFTIDAGTFAVSAVLLFLLRPPAQERTRARAGSGLAALAEAVRYVRCHKRVLQLILVAVVVWSCGAAVRSTMAALVRDVYQRPDYLDIGVFQFYLGLGLLLGAVILTVLGDALRSDIAISWSLAGIAVALGTLTLTVFAPFSPTVAHHLGAAAVIVAGIFSAGVMTSYNALLQRIVPNRLRGRVFGLTDLVSMAGLLLATGMLGIPGWRAIDEWIGWILLGVTAIVLAAAVASFVIRLRGRRFRPGLLFWRNVTEFYCRWWFRLRREGLCTVPAEGPVIIVANHTCAVDPLLLVAAIPNRVPGFLIAREYHDLPVGGRLTRMIGCIPVNRDGQDTAGTKAAIRHLRDGNALGIFIEGRIARPGEVLEPKEGAAILALRTDAVVIPAHISGTIYDERVVWSFFRRHRARVRFGPPIDLTAYKAPKPDRETTAQVSAMLLQRIRDLGR